jgi:lipooligosaccharide transport system permease protein
VSLSLPHTLSVWWRNAAMYRRTWKLNILPNFFEPVFYLAAIGIGVGSYIQEMGGTSYAAFLAPGLVCVAAMNGASFEVTYNVFVRLTWEKTYDAMLTAPVEPDDVLAGEVLWALTRASIYGGAFFVVVAAFGHAPLPRSLLALPAVVLSGLLFASLGIAFSLRIAKMDFLSFYFTLFLTPLFLFSDVFFPIDERFTGFWQGVAEVLPLLHPVRAARAAFEGTLGWQTAWDVAYVLGVSALLLADARRTIRRRLTA